MEPKTLGELEEWYENLSPEKKMYLKLRDNITEFTTRLDTIADMNYKDIVYLKWKEFREDHSESEAYDLLYDDLKRRGIDPEEYDMNGDHRAFARAFNKYKTDKQKDGNTMFS